ncbi:MAG: HAMP domain-containing histidine kinase [Ruminococcus flavefaciens]|nr:HAMP domain-containing histidine kinase [Ruminococcus flavefaciens]
MLFVVVCIMVIVIAVLGVKLYLVKKSVREIMERLSGILSDSTNILIDISSRDRDMIELADSLNKSLRELRRKRHIYEHGDRELKEAITNISHDLRTPLTAITGYLDLMENIENEEVRHYTNIIRSRTDVMKQLTEELFRYSIIVSVQENSMENVCINDVLEETLAGFYGEITKHGIVPDVEITDSQIIKRLDKSALSRIFSNVISNAIKYSDGDFHVKMTADGMVTFANSAKGLTSIETEKLFDRFYTVKTARNSTGLGLSIAKLLTERMGGNISAEISGDLLTIKICL